MASSLARLRPLAGLLAVGATVAAWMFAFDDSWGNDEWSGYDYSPAARTRGANVGRMAKKVETTEEREERTRELIGPLGLKSDLNDVQRRVLGNSSKTRGDDIRNQHGELPPELGDYTPRDACQEMKLEYPDRFGDLDCTAPRFDNGDTWLQAERTRHDKPGQ